MLIGEYNSGADKQFELDAQNNILMHNRSLIQFDESGTFTSFYYEYNDKGNVISSETEGYNGNEIYHFTYTYNDYGDWIERTTYLGSDKRFTTTRDIEYYQVATE